MAEKRKGPSVIFRGPPGGVVNFREEIYSTVYDYKVPGEEHLLGVYGGDMLGV